MSKTSAQPGLLKPHVISAQWLPMGRNNLIALNRFLGSHKKYKSATEFGIKGTFRDITRGSFKMKAPGVLLKPENFDFNSFIETEMRDDFGSSGLYVDHTGCARIGLTLTKDKSYQLNTLKKLTGILNSRFVNGFYPVLSETQTDLLETLYGSKNLETEPYRTISYSLVIAENCTMDIQDAADFNKEHPRAFAAFTDWVSNAFTIGNCHVFVGMSAAVCIGTPDENLKRYLDHLLFSSALFNVSQRLYARITALGKDIQTARESIPGAQLKYLMKINKSSASYSSAFARLETLDSLIVESISKRQKIWNDMAISNAFEKIGQAYEIETEKSADRILTVKHLKNELDGLNEASAQRLDEIMSRNGEFMNIVLLIMTILTIVGFGDIFGLPLRQTVIILAIMLPFIIVAFYYIRNYFRNYTSMKRKKRKK